MKKLKALFNPAHYHGWGKTSNYFEGWYYKMVSADGQHAFAFIPGIAMAEKGNAHSFIQILDGTNQKAEYIKFAATDFSADENSFSVEIANNHFYTKGFELNMPNASGKIQFKNQVPWPSSLLSPGIMGPFSFVPFMQCYHGIISIDHEIEGSLIIDNKDIDFTGGRGYLEKDWGNSFPSAYFWMQSNHFSKKGISFKSSVANIPWLGSSFVGFIAGLYFDGKLIQFTTYNFTKLKKSFADKEKVIIHMKNSKHLLEIHAHRNKSTELAAPIGGLMDGRVSESMNSKIDLCLKDAKSGKVLFKDTGHHAALEVAGKIEEIMLN